MSNIGWSFMKTPISMPYPIPSETVSLPFSGRTIFVPSKNFVFQLV